MPSELEIDRAAFLSSKTAGPREVRFAILAVLASIAIFCAIAPFAAVPLVPTAAFIPAYQAALSLSDLITAVLLFSQFKLLHSRALFALACGYLFTALIAVAHALSFPGLFAPAGLLGGGPQTTAWMFMFWHGGFPIFVVAYVVLKRAAPEPRSVSPFSVYVGAAAIAGLVCGLTLIATTSEHLPTLVVNGHFTHENTLAVAAVCLLSVAALAALWRERRRSVLDLWLLVVMGTWLFDVALSAVLNASRYDLGWYAGRLYGLLSATFLLSVLLVESSRHYARLAALSVELGAANRALEQLSMHDGLTGLANRRSFDSYLESQVAAARRHKRSLALILCDLDEFKAYNDRHGHQAGDECLKSTAVALRGCCRRPADRAARYGGEEFALILPDTDRAGAVRIGEAARNGVSASRNGGHEVTISGGVAVLDDFAMTADELIGVADKALYHAKHLGRNRMVSGGT